MFKKSAIAVVIAGSVWLTGCGGGGGGGGSDADGGGSTTARNDVAGPLDAVQTPVSDQVLAPLQSALAGTPLAGVVGCVNEGIVNDTLDIVDALAVGVQAGALNPMSVANGVQAELSNLTADLQGLLAALAGGGSCGSSTASPLSLPTNLLSGTQLASLGNLIPVLSSLQGQLGTGAAPGSAPSLTLDQLNDITGVLKMAYSAALAAVPAQARNAPVVGGSLDVISTALDDLTTTLGAAVGAASNPGAGLTATANAITVTVNHLLTGITTKIVPISLLEDSSGSANPISGLLTGQLGTVTSLLPTALLGGSSGNPTTQITSLLTGILNPFQNDILAGILGPLQSAIGGNGSSLPVVGTGLTGTPLDGVLSTLTGLLTGVTGGSGGSIQSPLTHLLGSILGGLGGGSGSGNTCPLQGGPLSSLCGILGS